jgi:diguanylate cyclase (GGDEF)-like protein
MRCARPSCPRAAAVSAGRRLFALLLALGAALVHAEPRSWPTGAVLAATGPAAAGGEKTDAVESRLRSIETLARREPQRALDAIARVDRTGLSARGEVRLAVATVRATTLLYRMHEAIALAERALPVARAFADPALLSQLLCSQAYALEEANRGLEALAAGEEALALADRSGDAEARVEARLFLAEHGARRGDFERAFAHLEQAWPLARASGAAALKAAAAYTGASLARTIDDAPAAIEGYRRAEDSFRADGDPLGEADSARALAGMLVDAGRYTEAVDGLQRALARYHALDDDFGIASGTALLARARGGLGEHDRAHALSDQALAALRTLEVSDALASALIDRARIELDRGRASAAVAAVEEARALLLRSDELRLRMRLHEVAATVYAALGRYREAHAALGEQLRLRERHDDQRLSRQLAAQRGRLESDRMAADLERARRDGERHRLALAQAERSARVQTALILVAGLIALAASVALLRIARRSRRDARLARTDFLTGAPNRRQIVELGQRLLAAARSSGEALAVLLLDLDHFKAINDDFGHQAGDRALRAVADELKRHLRRGDELGRYGGEEFAVLLPGASVERSLAIAERLRAAVATLAPESLGLDRALTVSVGLACARGEGDFGDLVARADRALYAAKQAGRNRVAQETEAAHEERRSAGFGRSRPQAAPLPGGRDPASIRLDAGAE